MPKPRPTSRRWSRASCSRPGCSGCSCWSRPWGGNTSSASTSPMCCSGSARSRPSSARCAAIFQEDAKRLLAYSSISQMGYAVFGLALMNHLGWLLAMMFVINHYVYKSMLFLAVGGVYKRTGTKLMYKMGGLITLMPFTFVSVLVGIIAMSGVPPLSGFGGRWLFYNGIMASDMRLPMVLIFMSGPIGFLYLFRLIHTIFLGQPKPEYRKLKEAPIWLARAADAVRGRPARLRRAARHGAATGRRLHRPASSATRRSAGTGRIDHLELRQLESGGDHAGDRGDLRHACSRSCVLKNHDAQKVKQFNIVFSAERPFKPQHDPLRVELLRPLPHARSASSRRRWSRGSGPGSPTPSTRPPISPAGSTPATARPTRCRCCSSSSPSTSSPREACHELSNGSRSPTRSGRCSSSPSTRCS